MLVLKRRVEESITISSNIKVKVLSVAGDYVNLGIEAPREIEVQRTENLKDLKNKKLRKMKSA